MRPRVACFAMGELGHFRRALAVVDTLVRAGAEVRVWTDGRFAHSVRSIGADFVDLFAERALDAVDDRSRPIPCRYVTFAGVHGDALAREVGAWDPALVVHDAFALIGSVVARVLGRPWVTILAGHAVHGATFRARLVDDPRLALDPRCLAAVERLRHEHGMADASPFSYVPDPSPWQNLYGQPAEWLTTAEHAALGPLRCFGSLPGDALDSTSAIRSPSGLRVVASFGTVVWRYFAAEAIAAFEAIAQAVARHPGARAMLTLGGHDPEPRDLARLVRPGVEVVRWIDQRTALATADVLVTHQGLGSTHEAIAARVPMISLPFFWDQPALAARCQALGLAVPLPRGPTADDVGAAIAAVDARTDAMRAALERAREWEARTLADRPAVARDLLRLARDA